MAVFVGQGDPRRSMELLWREAARSPASRAGMPGPKPGLSVDAVVDAAIEVADEVGTAALSMRLVGERLGRTAMALYTYVQGKAELVDLMYDKVLGELPASFPQDRWRDALVAWAEVTREFQLRHPWVSQVSEARPVLGPNEYLAYNALAGVLRRAGLRPDEARATMPVLVRYVDGAVRAVNEARQAARTTGVSDEEWWNARAAALAEVAPDHLDAVPDMAWLESRDVPPPEHDGPYLEMLVDESFHQGLAVILDGIEARLAARTSGTR
ncbi:TetR/AcrR family transcriptional regulator C-terminal domain-containing protein [Actinomadura oligospora]|uniref:TetR/AcrR family transcriptional regulator C-terminal domain-containing protein n=1 Tax=Actinomadura oligospora TaxID=111804 RepID=UPI000479F707|nr:TetR/AcrR family transcriptional regulator C-terminal domain-containing protein [Actinomadura oligospora]